MRKATPTDTVRYVYDGQQMLLLTDDDNTAQQHYTWGAKRPLALDDTTDGPQYYLLDALGSVVGLSRPDGSLQSRTQYDAWGQTQATTGTSANRLGFTGHERDADSGLYYAKARYYEPALGNFLSTDPATADLMHPPSFHPYLYAYANPTVYLDPDGAAARMFYETFYTDYLDTAATYYHTQFARFVEQRPHGVAVGLATAGSTVVHVVQSVLKSPVQLGEEIGRFAAEPTLEHTPGLGALGTQLGESTARLTLGPTLEHGVEAFGALSGAALSVVGGVQTAGTLRGAVGGRTARMAEPPRSHGIDPHEARQTTAMREVHEVVEHPADVSSARLETPPPPKAGEPHAVAESTPRVYHVSEVMDNGNIAGHGPGAAMKDDPDCSTPGGAKSARPVISLQKQAGHIPGTPQNANRIRQGKPTSSFFGEKSGEHLTQEAFEKGAPVPRRPNVKEYDFGVSTGTGPNGGMQTRVRVHEDSSGRIHGHPSGPERF